MPKTREYTVFVYNSHIGIGSDHRNKPLAYLRYQSSNACVHKVREENGARAKSLGNKTAQILQ